MKKVSILGRKILVIFVKSFISFLTKATSAFFNKKLDEKNDFNGKNRSSFDKIISFFLTKIFGFCSLTTRLNSVGLMCILVFLNPSLTYRFTSLALLLIKPSNLSVSIPK